MVDKSGGSCRLGLCPEKLFIKAANFLSFLLSSHKQKICVQRSWRLLRRTVRSIAVQLDDYGAIRNCDVNFPVDRSEINLTLMIPELASAELGGVLCQERHIPDPFAEAVGS